MPGSLSSAAAARRLLRAHRYGALCTLSKRLPGFPFGSITPYLVDQDGSLLILVSALAEHTKNILHDPHVSLITHNQADPNIQMQGRVTVVGHAHRLDGIADERYLRLFPEARELLQLDFAYYRIRPVAIRYIGGIGSIHWIDLNDYAVPEAALFTARQQAILDQLNRPDSACRRLLQSRYGMEATVIAFDCDGMDVQARDQVARIDFSESLTQPEQVASLSDADFRLQQP